MLKFIERLTKFSIALLLALGFFGSLAPLAFADELTLVLAELPVAVEPATLRPDTRSLMAELHAEMKANLDERLQAEIDAAKPVAD